MPLIRRLRHTATRIALLGVAALLLAAPPAKLSAQDIPSKLTDAAFWKLVTDFSEANGYFRSDNFVSNELTFQWVIPELQRTTKPGGVYLGVGPDQNFAYLIALKPKIAFIFDIRRQNMLTHLMYKALFEGSKDRADFIGRLFARPRPAGLDTAATAEAIFTAYTPVLSDSVLYRKDLAEIDDRLTRQHGFALSAEDLSTIEYVYSSFVRAGPDINYNYSQDRQGSFSRGGRMPSFADMQAVADSNNVHRGYLSTEANFRAIQQMENDNLIVPLVGDFAGPKAIRSVGAYLKEHHATVTAFYLSNVEQYLFGGGDEWSRFYTNVGTLPLDSSSTFIRSVFNTMMNYSRSQGPMLRGQQMLASMMDQLKRFNEGRLTSYYEVIQSSR